MAQDKSLQTKTVIVGAGGNTRVLIDCIRKQGKLEIACVLDDDAAKHGTKILGVNISGSRELLPQLLASGVTHAVNGVGSSKDNTTRNAIYRQLESLGFERPAVIHPSAILGEGVALGAGALVMAGVVINPLAQIGANALVNTGTIIEHDCLIMDDAFIAPGCVLAGGTRVGESAFVGVGARSIQGISIGASALVAAGAVLIRDVPSEHFAWGIPAQTRPKGPRTGN